MKSITTTTVQHLRNPQEGESGSSSALLLETVSCPLYVPGMLSSALGERASFRSNNSASIYRQGLMSHVCSPRLPPTEILKSLIVELPALACYIFSICVMFPLPLWVASVDCELPLEDLCEITNPSASGFCWHFLMFHSLHAVFFFFLFYLFPLHSFSNSC